MPSQDGLLQEEIIRKTGIHLLPQPSINIFRTNLAAFIHELINHDFNKLILLLYRLDINENKLKEKLAQKDDAGVLIADMIITREAEKMEARKKYTQPADDIPETDRW